MAEWQLKHIVIAHKKQLPHRKSMDGYETRPFLMDSIKGGNFIGFC
jgi:hypothetical protein